jgi:hypothetical protein
MAEFLGMNRQHVWECKAVLSEKGLICRLPDGYASTVLWDDAVTLQSVGKSDTTVGKSDKSVGKSDVDKDNKETISTVVAEAPRVVYENEDGESRPKREKKNTPEILAVFGVFTDNPDRVQWKLRQVERTAAQALLDEYGLTEVITRYAIVRKYRDEPLCPFINSPSSMLAKMGQMERFLKSVRG